MLSGCVVYTNICLLNSPMVTNCEVFHAAPAPPMAATISAHCAAPSAHVLRLPATTNPFASLPIPQLKPAPVNPRYHEAHQYYNEMQQYYASKAYTSMATAELVVVKVQMATLKPGKRNPTLISVSNIFFSLPFTQFNNRNFRIYMRLSTTFQFILGC